MHRRDRLLGGVPIQTVIESKFNSRYLATSTAVDITLSHATNTMEEKDAPAVLAGTRGSWGVVIEGSVEHIFNFGNIARVGRVGTVL